MKTKPVLIVAAIILAATGADRASAQTQAQMNEEACRKFKSADAGLDRVLKQILAKRSADSDFVKAFQAAQEAWMAFRDAHVASIFPDPEPTAYGSAYPLCRCNVLDQITTQRAEELRKLWVNGIEEGDICMGSYAVKSTKSTRNRKR